MRNRCLKRICILVCAVLCVLTLAACERGANDPLARTAFVSLEVKSRETAEAIVSLDYPTAQAHEGEQLSLYAILPGEERNEALQREPVASAKVATEVRFTFPVRDDARDLLYASFAVGFADGTMTDLSRSFGSAKALAKNDRAFLWGNSRKGLVVSDPALAEGLYCAHAMIDVVFSSLLAASDMTYSFHGETYALSSDVLKVLDGRIKSATDAGMQVSLRLIPNLSLSEAEETALIDFLASRYAGNENGCVSAMFLTVTEEMTASDAARCLRACQLALSSRVGDGRVYCQYGKNDSRQEAVSFFADVSAAIAREGAFAYGAAVVPAVSETVAWETAEDERLTLQTLPKLKKELDSLEPRPFDLAVCDLRFSALDEDVQAVSYAYAYAKAVSAGAGMIFYAEESDDAVGLTDETGNTRRICEIFASIDGGLSVAQQQLCKAVSATAWETIRDLPATRTTLFGIANAGVGSGESRTLYDFTLGDSLGFASVGGVSQPTLRPSAAWDKSVLYTWLDGSHSPTGVRKIMSDARALEGATSLSVQSLTQYQSNSTGTLRLMLQGVDSMGDLLCYEAEVTCENGSWRTSTFHIASFTARADLTKPCVLTLVTEPNEEEGKFVFWIKEFRVVTPQSEYAYYLPMLVILLCVTASFLVVFLIHHKKMKTRLLSQNERE